MCAARPRARLSLRAKVMAAVLAVLVALPLITLWLVDQRLWEQMQRDAERALSTARLSFVQALKLRTNELTTRFRSTRTGSFVQILRLNDAATMKAYLLNDVLELFHDDTEIAVYVGENGEVFTYARRGAPGMSIDEFAK